MTREEARKAAEVMLAYADGKEIEFSNARDEWNIIQCPTFNWNNFNYRIKNEPTYRPFKDEGECWNEMQKHQPFGWLKRKSDKYLICLSNVGNNTDFIYTYNNLTFADGTPFGVLEDE